MPDCPDDLGQPFREMVVIDRDSLRAKLEVTIAIRQRSTRASGVFSVDLETGRRYSVFIVLVRH